MRSADLPPHLSNRVAGHPPTDVGFRVGGSHFTGDGAQKLQLVAQKVASKWDEMDVSKNRGEKPKTDGENNGKSYQHG